MATSSVSTGRNGSAGAAGRQVRPGADGILAGALRLFFEIGYGGTTVRMIAAESNVTVAALYHHFASKQEILLVTMRNVMTRAIEDVTEALQQAAGDPASQLRAAVRRHVLYHVAHPAAAVVAVSELRSLDAKNRRTVTGLRDRYQKIFTEAIQDGIDEGVFHVDSAGTAARAILSMCNGISSWYQLGAGPLDAEGLADQYCAFALKAVGRVDRPAKARSARTSPTGNSSARSRAGR